MRNTLIIRGLPTGKDEKTWNDTANAFATHLTQKLRWDDASRLRLLDDIERIHRGHTKEPNQKGPPVTYVHFQSWKCAQSLIRKIVDGNKRKHLTISVQQMYSKQTMIRMDEANQKRKSLKEDPEKSKWAFFVKYPGVLMVRKDGETKFSEYLIDK